MPLQILILAIAQSARIQSDLQWGGEEILHIGSRESEIDETHRFQLSFKVAGREGGMWLVGKTSTLMSSKMGDVEMPPPPYKDPIPSKQWISPAGFLLDAEPFDSGQFELDRLLAFWLPENDPAEWSATLATTLARGTIKAHARFKLIGKPAGPSREFALSLESDGDNGLVANGRLWFDVKSGRLLTAKIEAKNALPPGGRDRLRINLEYTDSRVKR